VVLGLSPGTGFTPAIPITQVIGSRVAVKILVRQQQETLYSFFCFSILVIPTNDNQGHGKSKNKYNVYGFFMSFLEIILYPHRNRPKSFKSPSYFGGWRAQTL
jgi:hypothetical protein